MLIDLERERCMNILSEIYAHCNKRDKELALELGYIVMQWFDRLSVFEKNHNEKVGETIEIKKLIDDNTKLFQENNKLIADIEKMKNIIDKQIPIFKKNIENINKKLNI